ncbi:MAG: SPASM domain-containing protein [Planctomycetota bacterium]
MTFLALVWADLERDFFGAPGTLAEDLAGQPVLARTVKRLATVRGLDGIVVATPPAQRDRVTVLLTGTGARMMTYEPVGAVPESIRHARAFGRYGWRGGLAGTTVFDEYFDPNLLLAVFRETRADALLLAGAGSVLLEVGWAERMVERYRANERRSGLVFSQAPVGLGGVVVSQGLFAKLVQGESYLGRLLAYDPAAPVRDPIAESFNLSLPDTVINTPRRFLADSRRGFWLCERILDKVGPAADGATVCRAANVLGPEPWPREVTIELTTRRPLTDRLRPTAERADMDATALDDKLAGLASVADMTIMFAGAGDALLHPQWRQAVAAARTVGRVGVATYGVGLGDEVIEQVIDSGLDVLQVYVDAAGEAVYGAYKTGGSAEAVWAWIEQLDAARKTAGATGPFIVPTMLKTPEALDEQDAFFERCLASTGWGLIVEPTTAAGAGADHGVVRMAPPVRTPCRRLDTRLTVLADGRVVPCEEDIRGTCRLGASVMDAWNGEVLRRMRRNHADRRWDRVPLCAACEEFFRP